MPHTHLPCLSVTDRVIALSWEERRRKLRNCLILIAWSRSSRWSENRKNPHSDVIYILYSLNQYPNPVNEKRVNKRWLNRVCKIKHLVPIRSQRTIIHTLFVAESFSRSEQLLSHSRNSQHVLEPDRSLPCLQELTTGPCPEPEEFSPHPHPTSLTSILILSSQLHLCLRSGVFPSGFPNGTLYVCIFCPMRAIFSAHLVLFDLNILKIFDQEYVMKLLIMQFSSVCYQSGPLKFKYSPQHPVLKHPLGMFFP
jgi:hypothetical protein